MDRNPPEIGRVVRDIPVILGICLAYFLSIRWGHSFVIRPELVAAFWPPSGLLTAVLLLVDTRYWPMVAGGAVLTAVVGSIGIEYPLLATTGEHAVLDCAQCLAVAFLSRRFLHPPVRFGTFRQVMGFVLISVACSGATSAMSAALLQGHAGSTSFHTMWRICWVSHSFGLLLITPAVLSWYGTPRSYWKKIPRTRIVEMILFVAVLIGATVYTFSDAPAGFPLLRVRSYTMIPLLVWGAARFGARGASLGALVMVSIAVYCTSLGLGPFAVPGKPGSLGLLSLQMFMGASLLSVFLLAAVTHEQWNALGEIEQRNRELSVIHRVSEIVSDARTEEEAIDRITEGIVSGTGFPCVAIEMYDGARERLLLKGARGFPVTVPAAGGGVAPGNPLSLEAARTGKARVETRSGERTSYRSDLTDALKVRTMFCVPMVVGGEVMGVLTLGHTESVPMRERPPAWVVSLAGTIAALVERKRAVEALRVGEERFRAIAGYTYAWENWLGPEGSLRWVNPAVERISGYKVDECMEMPNFPIPLIHPDDVQKVQYHLGTALRGSTGENLECRIRRKDGSTRWISVSWQPIFDAAGKSLGYRSGIRDITARVETEEELRRYKAELESMVSRRTRELQGAIAQLTEEIRERLKTETSLRESESRFRSVYNTSLHGIAIFDPGDGIIAEANRKFHEMLGHGREELCGKSWFRQIHREDGLSAQAHVHDSFSGPKEAGLREYRFWGAGGRVLWGRVALSIIPGEDGRQSLMAGMVDDVTDRHRYMEDLLKYQEELRSLAVYLQTAREAERVLIAREIHDELGQMLTALKMDAVLLEGQVAGAIPSARPKLESMKATLDATIGTVKRIAKELRPNLLDHFGLVAAIEVHMKEFAERTGIKCQAVLRPNGSSMDRGLSISVFRVCQEALTNIARHANARRARVRLTEETGLLCLTIVDDGRGISPREISDCSSLGLIGIRERVRPLGGGFPIRGIRGRGTVLSVKIPVHPHAMVG